MTDRTDAVRMILVSLDLKSSLDNDGVHPSFLKLLADELSDPLAIIYNSTLQIDAVTVKWLSSIVVLVYPINAERFVQHLLSERLRLSV